MFPSVRHLAWPGWPEKPQPAVRAEMLWLEGFLGVTSNVIKNWFESWIITSTGSSGAQITIDQVPSFDQQAQTPISTLVKLTTQYKMCDPSWICLVAHHMRYFVAKGDVVVSSQVNDTKCRLMLVDASSGTNCLFSMMHLGSGFRL